MAVLKAEVSVPLRGFRGLHGRHQQGLEGRNLLPFQSPCGVLGVCRYVGGVNDPATVTDVSVPLRGFRGLQVMTMQHERGSR